MTEAGVWSTRGLAQAAAFDAWTEKMSELHLAFAGTGTTVGRWIRDRRLRVCYRELARAGTHQTVTDIAFRWGFNDMAHFSRTFKQAFGVTPSGVLSRGRTVAAAPAGGPSDSHPVRTSLRRYS